MQRKHKWLSMLSLPPGASETSVYWCSYYNNLALKKKSLFFFLAQLLMPRVLLYGCGLFIFISTGKSQTRKIVGGEKKKKLLYTKAASAFQILALEPSQLVPSVLSISAFIVKLTPSLISGLPGSYNTQHSSCASLAASVQTEMGILYQTVKHQQHFKFFFFVVFVLRE